MDISVLLNGISAAFGFILYEALRVYRERWWEKVKRDFNVRVYIICISFLCLGISILATLISEGSSISSFALGFTFPVSAEKYFAASSNIKNLSSNSPNKESDSKDVSVDQINVQEVSFMELWILRFRYVITGNNPLRETPPKFY